MTTLDTTIGRLLTHMLTIEASDLYLTAGSPPVYRKDGVGLAGRAPFSAEQVDAIASSVMTDEQKDEFARKLEMNLALATPEGRFRVNIFRQRGSTGLVVRLVRSQIKTLDDLGHPEILKKVILSKRGLVLVVGGTGSGKSTTLAAMIDHRNRAETGHIVTVEDPIEFMHPHKQCVVTQREVGVDTLSYADALKNTLRQAPDVIMIGEVRTREGMDHAIAFAETGHLVLCTLHANNANQAMDRIINFFPEDRRSQLLMDLSLNLKGVVAQQLVPTPDGKARRVAMEIMLGTPLVQDYIRDGEIHKIKEIMKESGNLGMRTFDQSLFELYQSGEISYEDALRHADSANEVRLRIKLAQGGDAHSLSQGLDGVELLEQ